MQRFLLRPEPKSTHQQPENLFTGTELSSVCAREGACVCVCVCVLGGGGGYLLAQKLQVSDGDFALLVPSFSNQPVRVHSWDGVDGDQLQEDRGRVSSYQNWTCTVHHTQWRCTATSDKAGEGFHLLVRSRTLQ